MKTKKKNAKAIIVIMKSFWVSDFQKLQLKNLIYVCKNNENSVDGVVFGRVDYVGSLGLNRTDIESDSVTEDIISISKFCKQTDLEFVVGGAVSFDAKNNLKKFKSSHLTRFETRKIIFDAAALSLNTLEKALKDAVHFELLWLFNKREYYSRMHKEDDKRIDMLEARWKILESQ